MGVLLEWINGRGFVNSDYVVSAKCHLRDGQMKLYVETVTGKEYHIKDPSDTGKFHFKLDWEKEGHRQLDALKEVIQGGKPSPKTSEISEGKKPITRKAK